MTDRTSSIFIDAGPKYIQTPSGKDVRPAKDHLDYVIKLNEIDTPTQRLYLFLNSYFDVTSTNVSHEAAFVRNITFLGGVAGITYGGISTTGTIRERFIRKNNAAAFNSQHLAQRKYYDYLVSRVVSRSLKYGASGALLCAGSGLIAHGSIVYRDKIYAPDWYVGFATMGALSRFMLGPKASLFGAGMGLIIATIGLGVAYGIEYSSGMSTAQIRYLNHTSWLSKRLAFYDKVRLSSEIANQEKFDEFDTAKGMSSGKF